MVVLKAVPSPFKATLRAHWEESLGDFAAVRLLPEVFACDRGWQTLSNIANLETKEKNQQQNKTLMLIHAPENVCCSYAQNWSLDKN